MTDNDPYSAPETEIYAIPDVPDKLKDLNFSQLKKLYHRSSNVGAIAGLMVLGLVLMTSLSAIPHDQEGLSYMRYVFIGVSVLYAITVFGLIKRTGWGRILGIIICALSLLNIPIGTIIGIAGLFAFIKAPELFGPNRITHKELKAEFKRQKAEMKKR